MKIKSMLSELMLSAVVLAGMIVGPVGATAEVLPIGRPQSAIIKGPEWVQGGTTAQLQAMLVYENGTFDSSATDARTWQVLSGPATINSAGLLTANSVASDTTATVQLRLTTQQRVTLSATLVLPIVVKPPTPTYTLKVSGAASVNEGSVTAYTAILQAAGVADQDVTAAAQWSVTGPVGTSVNRGNLTAGQVTANSTCTLTATYDGKSGGMVVNIIDVPVVNQLVALEIRGARVVVEGVSADYTCIAYYSDESWVDVTQQAVWSIANSSAATVSARGHLEAGYVDNDTQVKLEARFGNKLHSINVMIKDVGAHSATRPVGIEVRGPRALYGGLNAYYTCEVVYSDNSRQDVTAMSQWYNNSPIVRVTSRGFLRSTSVEQDTAVQLQVRYITRAGILFSMSVPVTITAEPVPVEPPQRSIEIFGAGMLKEESTTQYQAILHEQGAPDLDITQLAVWSVDKPAFAGIGAGNGILTAAQVASASVVTIRVDYTVGDLSYSQSKAVEIQPITRSLTVTGAAALDSGATAQYHAVLSVQGSGDTDVTPDAVWSVDKPLVAAIDANGVLTALDIASQQSVVVTATYAVGIKNYSDTHVVVVAPALKPVGNPTGLLIVGPSVVESGSTEQFACYFTYSNGAKAPAPTARTSWQSMTPGVTINSSGALTASEVTQGFEARIQVRYDRLVAYRTIFISTRGKFALVGAGDPVQPIGASGLVIREGTSVTLAVERYQGIYQSATAGFVSTPADRGINFGSLAWGDGEDGVKYATVTAPLSFGVQPSYSVEVELVSSDIGVNQTANRVMIKVLDSEYGSSVEEYLTVFGEVPLSTSGDEWFYPLAALSEGANMLRSMSPSATGERRTFEASVEGPGILTFHAGISNADMTSEGAGSFTVSVDGEVYDVAPSGNAVMPSVNVDELIAIVVPDGAQSVSFVFERTALTQAGDYAWVADMGYTPIRVAELLAPANGSTVLAGDKQLVWSNVLGPLSQVSSIDAHYVLRMGASPNDLSDLDMVTEFADGETVAYDILLEEGDLYWQVTVVVETPTSNFRIDSAISAFSVLDASGPQFEVSKDKISVYKWLSRLAFDGSSMDISLISGFQVEVGPLGYSVDAAAEGVVVEVLQGSLPGLVPVVNSETREIYLSGTPGAVGSGSAVLGISMLIGGTKVPGTVILVNHEVTPFPQKLKGAYTGFVKTSVEYNCTPDGFCQAASVPVPASVTVAANGAVSIALSLPNRTYSANLGVFDPAAYYRLGTFERDFADVTNEDESINYSVSIEWSCDDDEGHMGTPTMSIEMAHWYLEFDKEWQDWFPNSLYVAGAAHANIWSDGNNGKDSYDQQVLDQVQGYYTVSLEHGDYVANNHDSFGCGYLTLTVNSLGKVSITGKLADGQIINTSSKLFVQSQCEDALAFVEFRSIPAGYKLGGFVYTQLHFKEIGGKIVVEARESSWVNMDPKASGYYNDGFQRTFNGICGGKYVAASIIRDIFPEAPLAFFARYPVYGAVLADVFISADGKQLVPAPQSGMSISVNLATGVIGVTASGGRTGEGVLTPYFKGVPGRESVSARAYLINTASSYVMEGDPTYQYQKSTAWQLEDDCGCN
ncbi:MAG: hypothetical protein PHO37_07615 [Kiritimatiellae bacterium]|nr:hypothetical protein [Kiritimatiellia bacterium]